MEISIFYKLIGFYSNNIKFCRSNINKVDWPWCKDSQDSISSKLQGKEVTVTVVQLRYLAKLVRGIFIQFWMFNALSVQVIFLQEGMDHPSQWIFWRLQWFPHFQEWLTFMNQMFLTVVQHHLPHVPRHQSGHHPQRVVLRMSVIWKIHHLFAVR